VKKIDSSGTTVFVYDVTGRLIAEYHSDPVPPASGGGGTSYLTSDHLGSTRVVTKSDGSVKVRYDYLPFGEELGSGIGSRTAAMGYSASDTTRQKFTGHERDNESGLDYFGARYLSSLQGRFTSPDPLLTSGLVSDPQSWNRYAYAFNNPLRFIDPFGLWNWDTNAGGSATDDELREKQKDKSLSKKDRKAAEKALKFREKFRAAFAALGEAVNSTQLSQQGGDAVQGSLDAYGTENDSNGVLVGTKLLGGPGSSGLNDDGTISVAFRENVSGEELITTLAHEGQHVADAQTFLAFPYQNGTTDLTHYDREVRAYYTGAFAAQAIGLKSYPMHADIKVWERGWKGADRATRMANAVAEYVRRGYPGENPGARYSQEYKGMVYPEIRPHGGWNDRR
jgi:RHS repeat-associated protein